MSEWKELAEALKDPWCKCKERKGLEPDIREMPRLCHRCGNLTEDNNMNDEMHEGMDFPVLADRPASLPELVYLAGLKPSGRKDMQSALGIIAGRFWGAHMNDVPWERLGPEHLRKIKRELLDTYHPATAKKYMMAVAGTLRQSWSMGLITIDHLERCREAVRGWPQATDPPPGGVPTVSQIKQLLSVCDTADRALFGLMATLGLRTQEAVSLDHQDIIEKDIQYLLIHGKGDRLRHVPLINGAEIWLQDHLDATDGEGPIFTTRTGSRLHRNAVRARLGKRCKEAGLLKWGKQWIKPHDLRRACITHLLEAGGDAFVIAKIVGHADPRQTMRYDRRPENVKLQLLAKTWRPLESLG